MHKKKYFLGDIENDPIYLIAIHTTLKDYQIAYRLNNLIYTNLKRTTKDIDLPLKHAYFSHFQSEGKFGEILCDLFSNKFIEKITNENSKSTDLFEFPFLKKVYLLSGYDEVDFFIKIVDFDLLNKIKQSLGKLNNISLFYSLNTDNITDKGNLIFY